MGQEDPLEKEMATHSSVLAWKNSTDRGGRHSVTNSVLLMRQQAPRVKGLLPGFRAEKQSPIYTHRAAWPHPSTCTADVGLPPRTGPQQRTDSSISYLINPLENIV